ncbi:mannitol dehydrogenase family protein [Modestobacter sp. VKM Ac-2977]|uniref:mannitol dehydrogenase family protein n=1 Tax=Modestobacter sp. VKM Ac-2977 TaxID=3004131 RepID=UPI0022AA4C84|nr:mannitol dehydrogenase family protein [Modestobacter sp. VKM Ac-2977]MCZ2822696.1 mannitol dehydrogenase family protein [Modestobacter sp. VKM Ac-2977]
MTALTRSHPAPPVRIVHLGLGSFSRAHQAWYTAHATDAVEWGIAAFTGRSTELAAALSAQDGLYTLVTRAPDGDRAEVVPSVVRAHPGTDHGAWLRYLADPQVAVLTVTVTEAGYVRRADGGPDLDHPDLRADLAALRTAVTEPVRTAPARLLAGLLARRDAGAGPLTVVPCDNLPDNGRVTGRVVRDLAAEVDPSLLPWLDRTVSFTTTMVDRITPRTTAEDVAACRAANGFDDRVPVLTEPFSEWVLSGRFPGGRPAWETAGAVLTDDVGPYEQRKLWLLNGAHSLLAYAGPLRGHGTVDAAIADAGCARWVQDWWDAAAAHLPQPAAEVEEYRAALLRRFANPRMRHSLAQIAADGSLKLPVRILPALHRARAAGADLAGPARVLAAWVLHLSGQGAPVTDPQADRFRAAAGGPLPDAVARVLDELDPELADDTVRAAVLAAAHELEPA